ncbi:OLC1v1012538C1 [Oldenlandia corymbosa var. corymbosa]|uniref:Probable purine permease n=1 Tax=Oldenlandia corymbosa var. corymbosa TaxID=529605 RepID=A0AAV1DWD0_OLDCO|nr:OLC1v1012538C1 [Oldenlandia corymbosa var. corymbosa]
MGDRVGSPAKKIFLVLSCISVVIGACGGPLITRLYFLHGGGRVWLIGWLHTGGWPVIFIPLIAAYFHRRSTTQPGSDTKLVLIKLPTLLAAMCVGVIIGVSNYFYCFGIGHLPVSTSSLILASQLIFTSFAAFIIVKQKFDVYTVNAVVLLSIGSAVLAMHAGGNDRPKGESNRMYILGFIFTFVSAAVSGAIFPLIELTYMKAKQAITYALVMEIQIAFCISASLVNIIGMIVNHDFQAISHEARKYQLGETNYYVVLVCIAIVWQFFTLGITGIIFCSSSLVSGIIITFLLPVTEVLAVICYHEKFQAEKAVALVLSLWGFASHIYGEFKRNKKKKKQMDDTDISADALP